jgi:hypothetical protein
MFTAGNGGWIKPDGEKYLPGYFEILTFPIVCYQLLCLIFAM